MRLFLRDFTHRIDTLTAREIGETLRQPGNILDFSDVSEINSEFIRQLLTVVLETREQTALVNLVDLATMCASVQLTFLQALQAATATAQPGIPGDTNQAQSAAKEQTEEAPQTLDPFALLWQTQHDYLRYVRTFQQFQNPDIQQWVLDHIENGSLLWKKPFVQLARPFARGDSLENLVEQGILHRGALTVFRQKAENPASPPIHPHFHQTQAVRKILSGRNVIVATGTGSGKSFAFGIPIVSEALKARERGIRGIKALIIYPMNALANSQYDEFARRLHGSGVRVALYTGDTANQPAQALQRYRESTGRAQPYDSEVLSREEIQNNPPDVLMTNYVMLELLLTRFEDRKLFANPGVLQFLVLDEVHTYSGKRGADVAALIRRLKQHTASTGRLRCIGTSATVESGGQESAAQAITAFASSLFGEPFLPEDVVTESYAPAAADLTEKQQKLVQRLGQGVRSITDLSGELGMSQEDTTAELMQLVDQGLPPKLHAFFSQGRAISACLDDKNPHLNDRGEISCPTCAEQGHARPTYTMVFCRACGQEYYSVSVGEQGRLSPAELDSTESSGRLGYLFLQRWDENETPLPANWYTQSGRSIQTKYSEVRPEEHKVCPDCGEIDGRCSHSKLPVWFLPAPFLFCPHCGIAHDRRSREFNKLFTFGSVGRSTATDVLVNAQIRGLPPGQRKVIAFSDNRQDTALQAAHMNSLQSRFAFRRALYQALTASRGGQDLSGIGLAIFDALRWEDMLPRYTKDERLYGGDMQADERYQQYLVFLSLQELRGTQRRTHQNLEDVGLLQVEYAGLKPFASDVNAWMDFPELLQISAERRYDLLLGLLDLIRKRQAIHHNFIHHPANFRTQVLNRLNEAVLNHDDEFIGPIGYSDDAPTSNRYNVNRLTSPSTQINSWVRRVLGISANEAADIIARLVEKLALPKFGFLCTHSVVDHRTPYPLYMIPSDIIRLHADPVDNHLICPKCLTVHRFQQVRLCTGSTCRAQLDHRDVSENYFRQMYTLPLRVAGRIQAEEHSGQVSGEERRKIEINFRDPANPLNVLICTPTMELGIDIGHLSAVTLRNVPPSPANYAQRAGRAGRSGQPSLISVFAGVGAARGPHDQYYYRYPEKMITGAIAAPRFRLDNPFLVRTHINALVLETLGKVGASKLPSRPDELLDLETSNYPLKTDLAAALRVGIQRQFTIICQAVQEAFAREMNGNESYSWFTSDLVERTVTGFVDNLDTAMERWRIEYQRLYGELQDLNRILGQEGVDPAMSRRRSVIERKLEEMREGEGDWYVYRYLGGEGFLPGYAFPAQAVHLSFDMQEDELARNPAIALSEYAPGNFIYYRGERFEVTHGRPKTRQLEPEIEKVLICPACQRSYIGESETNRAACECGQSLEAAHPHLGMAICDMFAVRRSRITADEEERMRQGYEITPHYLKGGTSRTFGVEGTAGQAGFLLTLESEGRVMLINHGTRNKDGQSVGFTLCTKCYHWLISEDAILRHVRNPNQHGQCPHGARESDLIHSLWLTHLQHSDLAIFDVPLPEGASPAEFYSTLKNALMRSIMVAFQVDESELGGFLLPASPDQNQRIILYETSAGGSGVLSALSDSEQMNRVLRRMHELLHGDDPENGCERACYECLLSFFNQREHGVMNRISILNWLSKNGAMTVIPNQQVSAGQVEMLFAACQSGLERQVLQWLVDHQVRLPDTAQHPIYDRDGSPIAISDFFYQPRLAVFVDGSPHYLDYVQAADDRKRQALRRLGYQLVIIRAEMIEEDLRSLQDRMIGT